MWMILTRVVFQAWATITTGFACGVLGRMCIRGLPFPRHIGSCGLFVKQNGLEQLPHSLGLFLVVSQDLGDAWPALEGAGEVPIATLIPSSKTLPVLHSISMLFYFDYGSFSVLLQVVRFGLPSTDTLASLMRWTALMAARSCSGSRGCWRGDIARVRSIATVLLNPGTNAFLVLRSNCHC